MPTASAIRPSVKLHVGADALVTGSGGVFEHVNPATGLVDARVPLAGEAEMDAAVEAAYEAFQAWRTVSGADRGRRLLMLADLIEQNADEFAQLGAYDNGTPVPILTGFVETAAKWTRYYAGWADKICGQVTTTYGADGEFGYTLEEPYGVIGTIITWNVPLNSLTMKIPAALAAGNTVVVKPSEWTPFTGELFMSLVAEAGISPGVVNLLPGSAEAGAALVKHPLVSKITFTGGPSTARRILHDCADQMKPVVLELGGKSANIIFDDADLDAAVSHGTLMSIAVLSGQGCAFATRMLVQDGIYDEVVERLRAFAAGVVVGDPHDPATLSGPVVNKDAYDRILDVIERAKADGARLVAGGGPAANLSGGYFLQPTVFADVDPDSDLAQNEVFGPVLAVIRFKSEDDAVAIANNTNYGLSGHISTRSLARAHRIAERLNTGEVLINGASFLAANRPFGGYGFSGVGKEGGKAGLKEFLRTKSVAIA